MKSPGPTRIHIMLKELQSQPIGETNSLYRPGRHMMDIVLIRSCQFADAISAFLILFLWFHQFLLLILMSLMKCLVVLGIMLGIKMYQGHLSGTLISSVYTYSFRIVSWNKVNSWSTCIHLVLSRIPSSLPGQLLCGAQLASCALNKPHGVLGRGLSHQGRGAANSSCRWSIGICRFWNCLDQKDIICIEISLWKSMKLYETIKVVIEILSTYHLNILNI